MGLVGAVVEREVSAIWGIGSGEGGVADLSGPAAGGIIPGPSSPGVRGTRFAASPISGSLDRSRRAG